MQNTLIARGLIHWQQMSAASGRHRDAPDPELANSLHHDWEVLHAAACARLAILAESSNQVTVRLGVLECAQALAQLGDAIANERSRHQGLRLPRHGSTGSGPS
jgi:hypothetical protein